MELQLLGLKMANWKLIIFNKWNKKLNYFHTSLLKERNLKPFKWLGDVVAIVYFQYISSEKIQEKVNRFFLEGVFFYTIQKAKSIL